MHLRKTKRNIVVAFLGMVFVLTGCDPSSDPEPGIHKNVEFGDACLADGGAWTYSEGNAWDSCTIYP